jgi:hypothetical protein
MRPGDLRRWVPLGLASLVLAGCSSSPGAALGAPATTSGPSPSIPASPSALASARLVTAPPTKGPPVANVSITGTAGLTGPVTSTRIVCNQPTLDGPQISFTGQAGTSGPTILIFATAGHVEVRVGTGAAATLRLRTFTGTGVTSFDAAKGLTLDATLTETADKATATGSLGALSAISGTIECGNDLPGSANIVVSGPSPYGQLAGALTSVDVTCTVTSSGTFVGVAGLGTAGTTPVLVFVTASTGRLQVAVETRTAGAFYTAQGAGLTTLVPGGATIAGDLPQSIPSGSTPNPNLIHVSGTATCGTTIQQ